MRVLCCPGQYGEGDSKVVMVAWSALIDSAALSVVDVKIGKLLISPTNVRAAAEADEVGFELAMQ